MSHIPPSGPQLPPVAYPGLTLREAIDIFATKDELRAFASTVQDTTTEVRKALGSLESKLDSTKQALEDKIDVSDEKAADDRKQRLPSWFYLMLGPLLAVLASWGLSHVH
jgi:hypothetical protein